VKNSVREERIGIGLSQQELANKISVSRQTIFAIETGKYVPSTILALKIAKLFHKQVEEIFILEKAD
jgi:putative transcriptional regulator